MDDGIAGVYAFCIRKSGRLSKIYEKDNNKFKIGGNFYAIA
jgi:hypothetical protein